MTYYHKQFIRQQDISKCSQRLFNERLLLYRSDTAETRDSPVGFDYTRIRPFVGFVRATLTNSLPFGFRLQHRNYAASLSSLPFQVSVKSTCEAGR